MEFSGEREVSVVLLANIMMERAGGLLTRCGTAGKSYTSIYIMGVLEIHFYNSTV